MLFAQLWSRLSNTARIGFTLGIAALLATTLAAAIWLLRPDYQVLFADLAQADAAAMTAELDKLKIQYKLGGDGNTILVPADQVYKTRLKLVGRDLPLHGTVGFELFNSSDLGQTDFAQKVNYQRALQGELTRTILAIEEIQSARVHLAYPEQTLFKKSADPAKASVSLTLKPGHTLQTAQIIGIQRLVAASAPSLRQEDVTVVDQHGVVLTRQQSGTEDGASEAMLNGKEALESYLIKKVTDVLDRTFGAGQSIASVDVLFNRDNTKVTTESVLGAGTNGSAQQAGVIVHEHQSNQGAGADTSDSHATPSSTINRDVDYQVGRRVEQVVSTPGTVSRINVAVVVRQTLNPEQIERIRDIVAMAAGINKSRGDGIAVYSINQFSTSSHDLAQGELNVDEKTAALAHAESTPPASGAPALAISADESKSGGAAALPTIGLLILGFVALLSLALLITKSIRPPKQAQLSDADREALLGQMLQWLDSPAEKQRSAL